MICDMSLIPMPKSFLQSDILLAWKRGKFAQTANRGMMPGLQSPTNKHRGCEAVDLDPVSGKKGQHACSIVNAITPTNYIVLQFLRQKMARAQ